MCLNNYTRYGLVRDPTIKCQSANRMNRAEFYASMAPCDDARLRKILWTLYWRGSAQLRERIEDELHPPEQPKAKPKRELPDPDTVWAR